MLEKRPPRSTDLPRPDPVPAPRQRSAVWLARAFCLFFVICAMMAFWRAAHDGRHVDQPAPTSIPPR